MSQSSENLSDDRNSLLSPNAGSLQLGQLAGRIKVEVRKAEEHLRDSVRHALQAGEYLSLAKELVKHGEWANWFESNQFEFGERTAQRYMRFYKKWKETVPFLGEDANPTALSDLTVSEFLEWHARHHSTQYPEEQLPSLEASGDEPHQSITTPNQSKSFLELPSQSPCVQDVEPRTSFLGEARSEDEWLTPNNIKEAAELALGRIDLDPAADPLRRIPAAQHYTREHNGLDPKMGWLGRVFLNPPLSRAAVRGFGKRLLAEQTNGNVEEAILLVPARTNEEWFRWFRAYIRVFISKPQFGCDRGIHEPLVVIYTGNRINRFFDVFEALGDCYVPYGGTRAKPTNRTGASN